MPFVKNKEWASKSHVKRVVGMVTCLLCGAEYRKQVNIHKQGCPVCTTKRPINHAW